MVGWTALEAVRPKEWKLLGWIGALGKQHVAGGDLLPEEICCRRRYIAGENMLPEEICCWKRYVTEGDMLLEGICYQSGYDAGGYTMLKVSSQRRDLAKGSIQPNEVSAKGGI